MLVGLSQKVECEFAQEPKFLCKRKNRGQKQDWPCFPPGEAWKGSNAGDNRRHLFKTLQLPFENRNRIGINDTASWFKCGSNIAILHLADFKFQVSSKKASPQGLSDSVFQGFCSAITLLSIIQKANTWVQKQCCSTRGRAPASPAIWLIGLCRRFVSPGPLAATSQTGKARSIPCG